MLYDIHIYLTNDKISKVLMYNSYNSSRYLFVSGHILEKYFHEAHVRIHLWIKDSQHRGL